MSRAMTCWLVPAMLMAALVSPAALQGQVGVQGEVLGAFVEHRVDIGQGVEGASGFAVGGRLVVPIGGWVEIGGHGLAGTLSPDSVAAEERTLAEGDAFVAVTAIPWVVFEAGGTIRAYESPLATQRWTTARVGVELRLRFLNGGLRGFMRGGLMPYVSIRTLDEPNLPVYAGAGLVWENRRFTAHLAYALERFDFPERGGVSRLEQLSMIRAGLGVRIGP